LEAIYSLKKAFFFCFFEKNGRRIKKKWSGEVKGNVYASSSFSLRHTKMSKSPVKLM
jgi:hypothetical protein